MRDRAKIYYMLAIKLRRMGKNGKPSYRMVVIEGQKNPRSAYIASLGFYNPTSKEKTLTVDALKVKSWISRGAKPSITVHNLLVKAGILNEPKQKVYTKKKVEQETKTETPKTEPAEKPAEA